MEVNVRHTGQGLEAEIQPVARTSVRRPRRSRRPAIEQQPAQGPQIELAVDAGYIRALPEKEGVRNLAVVASKLVQQVACHGHTHAYVGSSDPHQGAREQARGTGQKRGREPYAACGQKQLKRTVEARRKATRSTASSPSSISSTT